MSDSFPYLTLARKLELPYADVLLAADWMDVPWHHDVQSYDYKSVSVHVIRATQRLTQNQLYAIQGVWADECMRRSKVL